MCVSTVLLSNSQRQMCIPDSWLGVLMFHKRKTQCGDPFHKQIDIQRVNVMLVTCGHVIAESASWLISFISCLHRLLGYWLFLRSCRSRWEWAQGWSYWHFPMGTSFDSTYWNGERSWESWGKPRPVILAALQYSYFETGWLLELFHKCSGINL